jgi:uncharacterized protein involved in outer membrane biogenesis
MSTQLILILCVIGCIIALIFFMRWMEKYFVHKALATDGFATSAVITNIENKKILTAVDQTGTLLVAQVTKQPSTLDVHIKTANIRLSGDIYHWIELSDGTRIPAHPI